ncbi:MAG: DapH/DapD/GlmU-related protein [Parabacteroides gordonii]|uniref:DapH/DapD/GlmU-related protein n=1 Tax=Parabacteroides gordonii TaxID=574930 RepID=UPI003A88CFAD
MGKVWLKIAYQKDKDTTSWSVKEALGIRIWHMIWLLFFSWTPKKLNFWRLFLLRLFGAKLEKVFIFSTAKIYIPWQLEMKKGSCLGPYSEIYNLGPVCFGEKSVLSQYSYICNGTHDLSTLRLPLMIGRINIGAHVFIGAKALILPGIHIGEGAVVGAGSVVTKDIESWTVVGGNPAREIKKRIINEDYEMTIVE